jgi:hypothetical protein
MIPALNIVAWGNVVPWADQRQIEQDLIISRAIIEIFSDPLLSEALRFRGGTALNKLHFAAPLAAFTGAVAPPQASGSHGRRQGAVPASSTATILSVSSW